MEKDYFTFGSKEVPSSIHIPNNSDVVYQVYTGFFADSMTIDDVLKSPQYEILINRFKTLATEGKPGCRIACDILDIKGVSLKDVLTSDGFKVKILSGIFKCYAVNWSQVDTKDIWNTIQTKCPMYISQIV